MTSGRQSGRPLGCKEADLRTFNHSTAGCQAGLQVASKWLETVFSATRQPADLSAEVQCLSCCSPLSPYHVIWRFNHLQHASMSTNISKPLSFNIECMFIHLNMSKSPKPFTSIHHPFGLIGPMPTNRSGKTKCAFEGASSPSRGHHIHHHAPV